MVLILHSISSANLVPVSELFRRYILSNSIAEGFVFSPYIIYANNHAMSSSSLETRILGTVIIFSFTQYTFSIVIP